MDSLQDCYIKLFWRVNFIFVYLKGYPVTSKMFILFMLHILYFKLDCCK